MPSSAMDVEGGEEGEEEEGSPAGTTSWIPVGLAFGAMVTGLFSLVRIVVYC